MDEPGVIEGLLKRDRIVVVAALGTVVALSWAYVLAGAGMGMSALQMSSLSLALGPAAAGGAMPGAMQAMAVPAAWSPGYAVLMFFMWWIMMIAMMLPSAAPMVLLHAAIDRRSEQTGPGTGWRSAAFTAGYLVAWAGFSAIAAGLQWGFEAAGLLSPMTLNSSNALFAGAILVLAGLYQLTPLKQACLKHCRSPVHFIAEAWRPGAGGAFRMGLHHGGYCLGCCWGLMALLFFGGIMNLYWIIGLALLVLAEKLAPPGPLVGRVSGALLLAWGAVFLVQAA